MNHQQNLYVQKQEHDVLAVLKKKGEKDVYVVWVRNPDRFGRARRYEVATIPNYNHEKGRTEAGFKIVSKHHFDAVDFSCIRQAIANENFFDKRTKRKRRKEGQYLFNKNGIVCIVKKGERGNKLKNIPLYAYRQEVELNTATEANIFAGMSLDEIDLKISEISFELRAG